MTRHRIGRTPGTTLGWIVAGTLVAGMAFAQGPGGPPPPFDGPGGGPPPFGRPGGGPPPPPPPATVATTPLALLDAKLKLTAAQDAKITQIQSDLRQQRDALRPPPGQRPEGPPPDRAAMRDKNRAMDDAASQKISAVLTADQRQSLPGVLSEVDALRADGIPLEVYEDLKLTADQEKHLTATGTAALQARKQAMGKANASADPGADRDALRQARQQTDEKVSSLLTAAQRRRSTRSGRTIPGAAPADRAALASAARRRPTATDRLRTGWGHPRRTVQAHRLQATERLLLTQSNGARVKLHARPVLRRSSPDGGVSPAITLHRRAGLGVGVS